MTSNARVAVLSDPRGTSLLEAVVAAALVVVMAAGVAHLLVWARRATWLAGTRSAAVVLASAKLEQLRALDWSLDAAGRAVSDVSTNISREPHTADGTGLGPSPPGTLVANTPGYVDFVSADGVPRGTGHVAPAGSLFVRRWAIALFPGDPADTLVLTVVASPLAPSGRAAGVARLDALHTRLTR